MRIFALGRKPISFQWGQPRGSQRKYRSSAAYEAPGFQQLFSPVLAYTLKQPFRAIVSPIFLLTLSLSHCLLTLLYEIDFASCSHTVTVRMPECRLGGGHQGTGDGALCCSWDPLPFCSPLPPFPEPPPGKKMEAWEQVHIRSPLPHILEGHRVPGSLPFPCS